MMLKDIIDVRPMENHRLHIRFEDGVEGLIDLTDLVRFDGVFALLRNQAEFERAYIHPELGTVCWPNGADLDPVVLYSRLTGQRLPYEPQPVR